MAKCPLPTLRISPEECPNKFPMAEYKERHWMGGVGVQGQQGFDRRVQIVLPLELHAGRPVQKTRKKIPARVRSRKTLAK